MADKYLIVVDMQNDFVTGSLGSPQAESITGRVIDKVRNFDGKVIFTQDTHGEDYLQTQEGRMLPVEHCMKNSRGWQLISALKEIRDEKDYPVYLKDTFGSIDLAEDLLLWDNTDEIESIELIGLCTDICVVSNALLIKAFLPETLVEVDSSCCAGVTPESHEAALTTMRSCQIAVK